MGPPSTDPLADRIRALPIHDRRAIEAMVSTFERLNREADEERERRIVEPHAEAIYAGWWELPGYVQWVPGGNSDMQEKARREARALIGKAA